ncbi:MAG: 2,3-bisphosphoglycerate-independent phosphoglycerate mutase [Gemmatimonadetes bacterium]|nr:2,3-bisphosphoglycerate-independent phosphoglycerate mutase [Gemmatimonadota bacterium]
MIERSPAVPDTGPSAEPRERPRVALLILDGWGLREPADDNAVTAARASTWRYLWEEGRFPRARLTTHGPPVGLPEGQMGNSEVGHLNLGAGRVVVQSLLRIAQAIESGEFHGNAAFLDLFRAVKARGGTLHIMGLIGPGGVHAVDAHVLALCELAAREEVPNIRLHAFLDGRDTPPQSARDYLTELVGRAGNGSNCQVATVIGRYWAMDRDRRWERTRAAYDALVYGEGIAVRNPVQAISDAYASGETDEFIRPRVVVDERGVPTGLVRDGDGVVFFNFRADRVRQITRALVSEEFAEFDRGTRPLRVDLVTMMQYDEALPLPAAFPPQPMDNLLADVLAAHGRTSFRTAETEKYPHVTYFFNGGVEHPPAGEDRRVVPSPKVATYDLQPEMNAAGVTEGLLDAIRSRRYDVMVCNYANPDMVGHTGMLNAAIAAVETVDAAVGQVLAACRETGTTLLVTADHGNCEQMWDPTTNGPHTAHTTNPVGIILVEPDARRTTNDLHDGALCDVAPTILGLLGIPQPVDMTGQDLRGRHSHGTTGDGLANP